MYNYQKKECIDFVRVYKKNNKEKIDLFGLSYAQELVKRYMNCNMLSYNDEIAREYVDPHDSFFLLKFLFLIFMELTYPKNFNTNLKYLSIDPYSDEFNFDSLMISLLKRYKDEKIYFLIQTKEGKKYEFLLNVKSIERRYEKENSDSIKVHIHFLIDGKKEGIEKHKILIRNLLNDILYECIDMSTETISNPQFINHIQNILNYENIEIYLKETYSVLKDLDPLGIYNKLVNKLLRNFYGVNKIEKTNQIEFKIDYSGKTNTLYHTKRYLPTNGEGWYYEKDEKFYDITRLDSNTRIAMRVAEHIIYLYCKRHDPTKKNNSTWFYPAFILINSIALIDIPFESSLVQTSDILVLNINSIVEEKSS